MSFRRFMTLIAILLSLLLCACRHAPSEHVLLDLDQTTAGRVRITATAFVRPTARDAFLGGRDDWSVRFMRVNADEERIIFDKIKGLLSFAEHAGTIDSEDLQRFFSDVPVTIQVTHGDGWSELTMYAGSSSRATREERERFRRRLDAWSELAARYVLAMHHLYQYLGEHPGRAESVFANLVTNDSNVIVAASEEERSLIFDGLTAMETIARRAPSGDDAQAVADQADLVLNPFPAEVSVRTPGAIMAFEGFERSDEHNVVAKTPELAEAIASLEGRWLSPDPLAMAIRDTGAPATAPTAFEMAKMPRRSTAIVTPLEISGAFLEKMKGAPRYRVRWREGEPVR